MEYFAHATLDDKNLKRNKTISDRDALVTADKILEDSFISRRNAGLPNSLSGSIDYLESSIAGDFLDESHGNFNHRPLLAYPKVKTRADYEYVKQLVEKRYRERLVLYNKKQEAKQRNSQTNLTSPFQRSSIDTSPMSRMKHSDEMPGYTGSAMVFNDGEHVEHSMAKAWLLDDPIGIIAESEIAARRKIAERKQKRAEKELAEAKAELEAAKKAEAQAKQNAEKERNRQTVKNTASAVSSKASSKYGNNSSAMAKDSRYSTPSIKHDAMYSIVFDE